MELGDYSYVVNDSDIAYAKIGKFTSIAAMTRINPGNHPMDRASQSHFSYRASAYFDGEHDEDEFFAWRRAQCVTIGHDVWIGHGAIVLPGRRIGTGAVIGAGSVVTKDIPAYAVAVGNPARVVRQRFSADDLPERMQSAGLVGLAARQAAQPPCRIFAASLPSSFSTNTSSKPGRRCRISLAAAVTVRPVMRIQGGQALVGDELVDADVDIDGEALP